MARAKGLLGLLVAGFAYGGMIAVDFTTPTIDFTSASWSLGWEFNVNTPIWVTRLGFYDDQKNDLADAHAVGIWDANQNLLVSGTVSPGAPLRSWWRWVSVTPTLLAPGGNYRIAAVTGNENYTWDPSGFTVDPAIAYVTNRYPLNPPHWVLTYPDVTDERTTGWFGPNFEFETELQGVIPEPATLGLMGLGLGALLVAARRQRN